MKSLGSTEVTAATPSPKQKQQTHQTKPNLNKQQQQQQNKQNTAPDQFKLPVSAPGPSLCQMSLSTQAHTIFVLFCFSKWSLLMSLMPWDHKLCHFSVYSKSTFCNSFFWIMTSYSMSRVNLFFLKMLWEGSNHNTTTSLTSPERHQVFHLLHSELHNIPHCCG